MLAPILAFTADEAWEFIPGKPTGSVHESEFKRSGFLISQSEMNVWSVLFAIRATILPDLEKARQAKLIGKSLDAKIVGNTDALDAGDKLSKLPELRELLNVSQLNFSDASAIEFVVTKADGQKCERCWHWETDIGQNAAHPTICGRCVEAVKPFKT